MDVAEDHRPPGTDVVDVLLAIGVPEIRTLRAFDEPRRAADRAKRAHRRVHTAGNGFLGAFEESFISGHDRACAENDGFGWRGLRPLATIKPGSALGSDSAGSGGVRRSLAAAGNQDEIVPES